MDFDDAEFSASLEDFAPGLGDYSEDDYQDNDIAGDNATDTASEDYKRHRRLRRRVVWGSVESKRSLEKRGFKPVAFLQKVATKAVAVVKKGQQVVAAVNTVVEKASKTVKVVAGAIKALTNPSIDTELNVNVGPKNLVDSPFGQAYSLFHKEKSSKGGTTSGSVDLYCVNCGVTGKTHVSGRLAFSLTKGITQGNVALDGNLDAQLNLGLAAEAEYKNSFKKSISSDGLPGFSIHNVITIGPVIALDAQLDIGIKAQGQVLVGAEAKLPNFHAVLDIVNKANTSVTGFTPQFTTTFNASGEISATAELGFPLTIGVGLDIIPLKTRKLISITNNPSVEANATYAYSNTDPGKCNNGIAYQVTLGDELSMDFFGLSTVSLFKADTPPLVSGCKLLGSKPSSSASSTASATATAPASSGASSDSATPTIPAFTTAKGSGTTTPAAVAATPDTTTTAPTPTLTPRSVLDAIVNVKRQPLRLARREPSTTTGEASPTTGSPATASSTDGTEPIDDSPNDADYQEDLASANKAEDAENADNDNDDDFTYATILDSTGAYQLSTDDSGNFGLVDASNADDALYFASYQNVTISDESDRIFHYYPDTLSKFGVSRFRISDEDSVPKTADVVTLVPIDSDGSASTGGVYVAVNSNGDLLFPVICNIEDQASKFFLVSDVTTGTERLTQADLRYIVTGGIVSDCSFVPLLSNGQGLS
ncbi:MAG: hypothetical protein M4579_001542 [Chaenotheca gracillima]|nr:MAG: hypothetical protein M4579_001542 [Chaenotheca gracillima]